MKTQSLEKYKGHTKRIWYQKGIEDGQRQTAEDICIILFNNFLIDIIESKSQTNTLEEWKQYKHIRNAIRDKYILKRMEGEK